MVCATVNPNLRAASCCKVDVVKGAAGLFFSGREKKDAEAQKHIKKFEEEPELEILNGRYGPYISYKGSNYKIPKDIIPQDLNLDACREIIKLQSDPDAPKAKRGKYAKKKK